MKFYPANMCIARKGSLKPFSLPFTTGSRLTVSKDAVDRYMRKFIITSEKFNAATPAECGQKLKIKG